MIRVIVVLCLLGIVASLGSGLFYLVKDKGESKRMVRALTIRITLSIVLLLFLVIAGWQGWIAPHGFGR